MAAFAGIALHRLAQAHERCRSTFATYNVAQHICHSKLKLGWQPMGSHRVSACAGIALHRLAQAHERRGDAEQAAYYYEMNLHRMDAEQVAGTEAVDALMYLAAYHKVLRCGNSPGND